MQVNKLPESRHLYVFNVVYNLKNFTRASEQLGMTQSQVSIIIRKLEDQFNANLFIRLKNGVEPTHQGVNLFEKSSELLGLWENLTTHISKDMNHLSGTYSISTTYNLGNFLLTNAYTHILSQFPELKLDMRFEDSTMESIAKVISFRSDIGLVLNPPKHPDLVIKRLFKSSIGIWGHISDKIQKALGNEKRPKSHIPMTLFYDPRLKQSFAILKKLEKLNIKFDKYIALSNFHMIKKICLKKQGLGIVPNILFSDLRDFKHSGQISNQSFSNINIISDEIALIYRHEKVKHKAFKQLVVSLEKEVLKMGDLFKGDH